MKKLSFKSQFNKEKMKEEFKEIFTLDFKFFDSTKKTFENLWFLIAIILVFVFFALIIGPKNYFNNHSDDVMQYFPITENYIMRLKNLDFTFFNMNNYFGASVYSDAYYVPIDIFTLFTFLTSFIIEFDFAFGLTELVKIFCGTVLFSYCLYLKKNSNKSIFITSFIYMCSGMFVCLMAFPAYLSMIFYLPLGYYCTILFFKNKKIYLPLYVLAIVFFNFYIAYTLIWFICFAFLLEFFQKDYETLQGKLTLFLKQGFSFIFLILIGVVMSGVVLYPSASFILNNTERISSSHDLFKFDIEQFVRILAKIFSPSVSTSFYGFTNSYVKEHIGFNITIVGLICLLSIFKYRDKISKTFQVAILLEVLFLSVPIFYMIFSGNELPYTRWVAAIMFVNLLALGHVITQSNLKINLHSKYNLVVYFLLISALGFLIGFYINRLNNTTDILWARDVLKIELIYFIVIFFVIILAFTLYKVVNLVPLLLIIEIISAMVFMFSVSFAPFNKIEYDKVRNELNDYLEESFNYDDNEFYRVFIDYKALQKRLPNSLVGGEKVNFNRTNSMYTNFRFFHSFYDKNTNDFSSYIFGDVGYQSQKLADNSNIYFNHLFNQKYLVTYSQNKILEDDCLVYFDSKKFDYIENKKTSNYDTYQLKDSMDFIVYDTYFEKKELAYAINDLGKMKMMLDSVIIDPIKEVNKDKETIESMPATNLIHQNKANQLFDFKTHKKTPNEGLKSIRGANYYVFDLSEQENYMDSNGYLYFKYDTNTEIEETVYIDNKGNEKKCLSNACYYENPIKELYVKISGDVSKKTKYSQLSFSFDKYDLLDSFVEKQSNNYKDKSLLKEKDTFKVKYTKENNLENIVYLPITYSENFVIDKDYQKIRVNGGFLGVVIPKDEKNIDFSITYVETNFYKGLKISFVGMFVFGGFIAVDKFVFNKKKKEEKDNEIN